MENSNVNNLDFLLGVIAPNAQPVNGGAVTEEPAGGFDLMLANLLGMGGVEVGLDTTGELSDPKVVMADAENPGLQPPGGASLVDGSGAISDMIRETALGQAVSPESQPVIVDAESSGKQTDGGPLLMTDTAVMSGEHLKALLSQEQVELEPGKYVVKSQSMNDGVLTLEVSPTNDPTQTIKVSIPSELLQSRSPNGPERVAFDWSAPKQTQLEDYFAKLNVSEIEISQSDLITEESGEKADTVVKIVANSSSGELILKSRMQKSLIKATPIDQEVRAAQSDPKGELAGEPDLVGVAQRPLATAAGAVGSAFNAQNPKIAGTNATGRDQLFKFDTMADKPDFMLERVQPINLLEQYAMGTERNLGESKTAMRSVRFELPENILTTLKPNGQSISIKINPEHLGPARLSLVMRQNKLSARLIVTSMAARNAIENSVDRLVEQLAKANIEVDKIEVTLANSNNHDAHDGLFQRQSQWSNARHSLMSRNHETFDLNERMSAPTIPDSPTRMYVGASGVNVLA